MRALGFQARLVQSFQPVPIKHTMLSKVGNRPTTKTETTKNGQSSIKTKAATEAKIYKCSTRGKEKLWKGNQNSKANQLHKADQVNTKKTLVCSNSVQQGGHTMTVSTGVSSDSNFEENCHQPSRQTGTTAKRQILSSDSEDDSSEDFLHLETTGRDTWIEVYNITDNKWICVDCIEGHLNRPDLCEQNATKPICYVVAVDNENAVKDVTKRYASKWMHETDKLRVQSTWWEDTLKPYSTNLITRDDMEDAHLNNQLQERPLPTSILEYKNHRLYVLKRHLLKFEALYPESATILGYCKGEAVYSRDCVQTLHSRETWLKQGLTIQSDAQPHKIVKSRPKKNKATKPHLALYGKWQTELYIPPPAVNGKVPRNQYGNVELFQPSMLPMGTVHLQIPGLHQTARKLHVDCAPAMVGWDYHGGFCHPVLDGYVVCKEFQEVLLDNWEKDMTEREKKLKQKRELRVAKNWKILVNGVLIRERLTTRFQEANSVDTKHEGNQRSWPQNKLSCTQK